MGLKRIKMELTRKEKCTTAAQRQVPPSRGAGLAPVYSKGKLTPAPSDAQV